eukprot:TRINITY_DN2648_c0_g1_i1.p1 TRINITY_DN2648_c0_g1~~TRINITY_DN2648_c0_g1_i1.p1  ORF type:complete len:1047 (+),score=254.89 TRINITY_DN2648_c0_g1_i1:971-4111(+)
MVVDNVLGNQRDAMNDTKAAPETADSSPSRTSKEKVGNIGKNGNAFKEECNELNEKNAEEFSTGFAQQLKSEDQQSGSQDCNKHSSRYSNHKHRHIKSPEACKESQRMRGHSLGVSKDDEKRTSHGTDDSSIKSKNVERERHHESRFKDTDQERHGHKQDRHAASRSRSRNYEKEREDKHSHRRSHSKSRTERHHKRDIPSGSMEKINKNNRHQSSKYRSRSHTPANTEISEDATLKAHVSPGENSWILLVNDNSRERSSDRNSFIQESEKERRSERKRSLSPDKGRDKRSDRKQSVSPRRADRKRSLSPDIAREMRLDRKRSLSPRGADRNQSLSPDIVRDKYRQKEHSPKDNYRDRRSNSKERSRVRSKVSEDKDKDRRVYERERRYDDKGRDGHSHSHERVKTYEERGDRHREKCLHSHGTVKAYDDRGGRHSDRRSYSRERVRAYDERGRSRHSYSQERGRAYDDRDRRSRSRDLSIRRNHDHDYGSRHWISNSRDMSRSRHHGDYLEEKHRKYLKESETYKSKEQSNIRNGMEVKEDSENDRSAKEESQEEYQERVDMELAELEEDDVEKIKEESRKRRQAILEKYRKQKLQSDDVQPEKESSKDNDTKSDMSAKGVLVHARGQDENDIFAPESAFSISKQQIENGKLSMERKERSGGLGEGSPKDERSEAFCDDIFGESPAGICKPGKSDGMRIDTSGLNDNWDDGEGYYCFRIGEVLDARFEIIASHGKGVFSSVVRARNLKIAQAEPEEVAIKIIRNNPTMWKAGQEELIILKKLSGADPDDKRHCVKFISSFKYRNHLCLVFESLHMNLREVLKKFGRDVGLNLMAVRAYAKQLFIALKHLKNCGVLHCDIKLDNILVNESKRVLKLCDFGNAMFSGKNDLTPYLVSRYYRAPEIILGLPYDHALDIWSVGCCLFELYVGRILFPGLSNNDMLKYHMELKGPFPKKMLRKGEFTAQHFDHDFNFHVCEEDPVSKKMTKRPMVNIKHKDLNTLIPKSPGEDPKMLASFKDLLDKIFILEPDKRITVSQALSHPFITGK